MPSTEVSHIPLEPPAHVSNGKSLAMRIISGAAENRSNIPSASKEELVEKSFMVVVSEASTTGNDLDTPTTELAELFINIRYCITHLFTLSTLIRRDRPGGRTGRHATQPAESDAGPDITYTKDKFPKLRQSPWLAERIGKCINQQRYYIRYRQKHRKKLAKPKGTRVTDGASEVFSANATTKATSFNEQILTTEEAGNLTIPEGSAKSVATSFDTTVFTGDATGRRIYQLTDIWLDGLQLGYNQHIECPYCRTIQFIKNMSHWK